MTARVKEKPPYRVPLVRELAKVKPNGYTVVSTFSGAGGSCLGFRMAGFRVVWASEFVPAAQDVYRANHPNSILDTRDIRLVQPKEILKATGLKKGDLDVLEGSPPCAAFSTAGKRERDWGVVRKYSDVEQRTDDLFFEYVRILRGLAPKIFVAENVSGLVKGVAKGYFKEILREFESSGYVVEARLLDSQWLGVPQARQRIFFVGVRKDLGISPDFPDPLPYRYSVRDALPWLGRVTGSSGHAFTEVTYDAGSRPAHTIRQDLQRAPVVEERSRITGRTGPHFKRVESEIDKPMNAILSTDPDQTRYEIETTRREVAISTKRGRRSLDQPSPTVLSHGRRNTESELTLEVEKDAKLSNCLDKEYARTKQGHASDKYFSLQRAHVNRPSPTVTALGGTTAAGVVHPTERRKFTIEELRRICSFPDDFVLTGTYAQQWERLGRSVPPLMMRAMAEAIRDKTLARLPKKKERL